MEDLGDFCLRNGYGDFADYARQSNVQNTLLELTEALIRERPEKPRDFLISKLKEDLPDVERKTTLDEHVIPIHQVIHLFEGTRRIAAEIVPKETINVIITETTRLLNCDRVSVFVYNSRIGMLILTASNLTKPIRVNPGQGIAGYVFTTKTSVNIPDCYQDSRFDQEFDKMTGYNTKSMIVVPIVDHDGEALGVLQAINKMAHVKVQGQTPKYEPFGEMDMLILDHLTQLVGVALRNAEIYREAIIASERSQGLLSMLSSLSQDLGAQSTILTVTMYAKQLVLADKCLCFIIDGKRQILWSIAADSSDNESKEIRIPLKAQNSIGQCAELKDIVVVAEGSSEEEMVQLSKLLHMGVEPEASIHTMLCVPIRCQPKSMLTVDSMGGASASRVSRKSITSPSSPITFTEDICVLGVICLINKRELDDQIATFTDEDIAVVDKFSRYVGDSLANSKYIRDSVTATPVPSEGHFVFGATSRSSGSSRRNRGTTIAIEEENEPEDEHEDLVHKRASCPGVVGKRLSLV